MTSEANSRRNVNSVSGGGRNNKDDDQEDISVDASGEEPVQTYDQETFGGMRAEFRNNPILFKVCQIVGESLESASIVFNKSGMSIQTPNANSTSALLLDLPPQLFDSYKCEGEILVHVKMEVLVNALRRTGTDNAKFTLTLELNADNEERLLINIEDQRSNVPTKHTIQLWKPEKSFIRFTNALFPNYRVLPSIDFYNNVNDLARIVEISSEITLTADNNVTLSIQGPYGESSVSMIDGKSIGYRVVNEPIDIESTDARGNFNALQKLTTLRRQGTNSKETKEKLTKAAQKQLITGRKKSVAAAAAAISNDDAEQGSSESQPSSPPPPKKPGKRKLEAMQALAKPVVDDEDEDLRIAEKPTEKIPPVTVPLSLLMLKSIAKGLKLDSETVLLIKPAYPVMFAQKIQEHGRMLIALAPIPDKSQTQAQESADAAMARIKELEDE